MTARIQFGDRETVLCPEQVVNKLPVIQDLIGQEIISGKLYDIFIEGRSGRLFRQVIDFFFYPDRTTPLTPALIVELDFYGYNIVPENPTIKPLIDFLQLEFWSQQENVLGMCDEIIGKMNTVITIDFSMEGGHSWLKRLDWEIRDSYREFPSKLLEQELGKAVRTWPVTILGVTKRIEDNYGSFKEKLNRAYQQAVLKQIAENRAFVRRLILNGFYIVKNQGLYQCILANLLGLPHF